MEDISYNEQGASSSSSDSKIVTFNLNKLGTTQTERTNEGIVDHPTMQCAEDYMSPTYFRVPTATQFKPQQPPKRTETDIQFEHDLLAESSLDSCSLQSPTSLEQSFHRTSTPLTVHPQPQTTQPQTQVNISTIDFMQFMNSISMTIQQLGSKIDDSSQQLKEQVQQQLLDNTEQLQSKLHSNSEQLQKELHGNLQQLQKQLSDNSEHFEHKLQNSTQQLEEHLQKQLFDNSEHFEQKLQNSTQHLEKHLEQKLTSSSNQLQTNITTLQQQLQQQLQNNNEHLESKLLDNTQQVANNLELLQEQMNNRVTDLKEKLDCTASQLSSTIEIKIDNVTEILSKINIQCEERANNLQKQIDELQVDRVGHDRLLKDIKESLDSKDVMLECTRKQVETNSRLLASLQIDLENIRLLDKEQEKELVEKLKERPSMTEVRNIKLKPTLHKEARSEEASRWPKLPSKPKGLADIMSSDSDTSDSQGSLAHRRKKQKTNLRLREPIFFGDSRNTAPEFISELEDYFALMDITEDKEKIMVFKQTLRGNHAKWCQIQLADTTSWEQLCSKFIAQYFNTSELFQEWESLRYNTYGRDCEGFVLKAWQLQTSLHADYNTRKKCSNIVRKLPYDIQVKVKENSYETFDEFLSLVKITMKGNHSYSYHDNKNNTNNIKYRRNPLNYNDNSNSPPRSPQGTTSTQLVPKRFQVSDSSNNYNNYESRRNPYFRKYTSNNFNRNNNFGEPRRENFKSNYNWVNRGSDQNSFRNRRRFQNYNRPYNHNNNSRPNKNTTNNKQTKTVGAITWLPIAGQPGAYTISTNDAKTLTKYSGPRSPDRSGPSTSTITKSPVHPNMQS